MKLVVCLLLVLVAGCHKGVKKEVLETSPTDPEKVTKRMVTNTGRDSEQVTSRNVVTKIKYTSKDRSDLIAHSESVCMLAGRLPEDLKYREVGSIVATKRTYGGLDEVMLAMADEGRRIGVEVIDGLQADHRFKGPLPWRFTSPVGVGRLLKLNAESLPFDCEKVGGQRIDIQGLVATPSKARTAPATSATPADATSDPSVRLQKLEEVWKKGLVSDDEYRTKRRQILEGM